MTPEATAGALEIAVVTDITAVDAADWDALGHGNSPFVEHAFLALLEESGSVGPQTGWLPHHLLVRDAGGRVVGAAPFYLKSHSYGEYIFDWGWAHAAERARVPYYPKLVGAVPFTPATGPRLLVHPASDAATVRSALIQGAARLAEELGCHSVHFLFTTETEHAALAHAGFVPRTTHQFHWLQQGWTTFEDFLAAMTAKRRKEVRRERRQALLDGAVQIAVRAGGAVPAAFYPRMSGFYRRTCGYRGGHPYLTERFFELLPQRLGHRVVAVIAERDGEIVAGTLNFRRGPNLYGRYWGTVLDAPALHFECCYYALIDYAISDGVTRFEAGAQGQHKIKRGLLPRQTYSAHLLAHPGLRAAVTNFCAEERLEVARQMAWLADRGPFRCAD